MDVLIQGRLLTEDELSQVNGGMICNLDTCEPMDPCWAYGCFGVGGCDEYVRCGPGALTIDP